MPFCFKKSIDISVLMYYCINQLVHYFMRKENAMSWTLDSDRPIFMQIIEHILVDIVSGKYAPGQKFPSVRDLAEDAAVNPNTMQRALSELEKIGLLYSERTSGRFITTDVKAIENLKDEMARDKTDAFMNDMCKIGLYKEDVIEIIKNYQKEKV